MATQLRTLGPDDWHSWYGGFVRAFGEDGDPTDSDLWRGVLEFDRGLAAVDGDLIIGTSGTCSLRTAVPGGAVVPTGGLTMVSVAPTHRRRGVLRDMLRWQLDDTHRRGEPLAALTASEPAIYGRFGYGVATQWLTVRVDTTRVRVAQPPGAEELRFRAADPKKALAECEALYARTVTTRPGMLERSPAWQRVQVADPPQERHGASALRCVLVERDGQLAGYARYHVTPRWTDGGADGQVRVEELVADAPAPYAALWRFLSEIDLTSKVIATRRPTDDPLVQLVSDMRRCELRLRDSMHLRPVEVGAALAARTYQVPVDVVLAVSDSFCPWNEGRWRLSGDSTGAVCERTDAPAELALSVRELGAAYLGGVSLTAQAAAGQVTELRRGALGRASLAFGSDIDPFLPHGF